MKLEYITFYCLPQFFISKGDFKMNLNTKTNTLKQILAKVMLVVVLLTSVLGLSGCELANMFTTTQKYQEHLCPFISYFVYVPFDDFLKMTEYIDQNNSREYSFFTFNVDNSEIFSMEEYRVNLYTHKDDCSSQIVEQFPSGVDGEIIMNEDENGNYAKIKFSSRSPKVCQNIKISDDTVIEIKSLSVKDSSLSFNEFPEYKAKCNYSVYIDGIEVMELVIAASSLEFLKEIVTPEQFDILKQYIVVVD